MINFFRVFTLYASDGSVTVEQALNNPVTNMIKTNHFLMNLNPQFDFAVHCKLISAIIYSVMTNKLT